MDRRKLLTVFGIAWLSAALLTWILYANTVKSRPQDRKPVIVAARDLPLGVTLKKGDLKEVKLLDQDIPRYAIFTEAQALRRVTLYPMSANEPFTATKLSNVNCFRLENLQDLVLESLDPVESTLKLLMCPIPKS